MRNAPTPWITVASPPRVVRTSSATQPDDAQEAWEYCVEVRRDDALIAGAQAALGLTAVQVDALFCSGAEGVA